MSDVGHESLGAAPRDVGECGLENSGRKKAQVGLGVKSELAIRRRVWCVIDVVNVGTEAVNGNAVRMVEGVDEVRMTGKVAGDEICCVPRPEVIGIQPPLAVVTDVGGARDEIFCDLGPEVIGIQPPLAVVTDMGGERDETFCDPGPGVAGIQPPLAVVADVGG